MKHIRSILIEFPIIVTQNHILPDGCLKKVSSVAGKAANEAKKRSVFPFSQFSFSEISFSACPKDSFLLF
jgi:hypothetical protein